MQAAFHEAWVKKFGGTLRSDTSYNPTDCFDGFPLAVRPPHYQNATLAQIGEEYHSARDEIMLANNEGMTKTYNRFHDPDCSDASIQKLRDLHVQMDNAVRSAYGWTDLNLEHGWIKTVTIQEKKDRRTGKVRIVEKIDHRFTISERARQEVLRRLLELNHKLYAEEVAAGLHDKGKKKKGKKEKRRKKPAAQKKPVTLSLFGEDETESSPVEPVRHQSQAGDSPEETVFAALQATQGWQSKAEILSGSGITTAQWIRVINALIEKKHVERKGQKRGTRYRLTHKRPELG